MPDFEIDCPKCNSAVKVSLRQGADQATVRCPKGHSIKLEDKGGGLRSAQKSLDELDEAIKRLGGKH